MAYIKYKNKTTPLAITWALLMIGLFLGASAAWLTHIFWTIKTLSSPEGSTIGQAALGFIGALMPPVGILHGIAIWLGLA